MSAPPKEYKAKAKAAAPAKPQNVASLASPSDDYFGKPFWSFKQYLMMDRAFKLALIDAIKAGQESAAAVTATVKTDYLWNVIAKHRLARLKRQRNTRQEET